MTRFTISMPHHDYEVDGALIASTDNRLNDSGSLRPRWVWFRILRSDAGMYVVERVAHSIVVHEVDAPCVAKGKAHERGKVVPAAMLPADVRPCYQTPSRGPRSRCHPDLTRGDVRLEQPLVTVFKSTDAADVKRWLTEANHSAGGTSDMLSRPVETLLEEAARNDPAFRVHAVRRIA